MRGVAVILVLLAGCEPSSPSVYEALQSWPKESPTVLTVDGRSVSRAEFETYWSLHPQLSKDEVVQALIERETLVGRALSERRGGAGVFDVARKRGMIRAMLNDEIETVEADLPADLERYRNVLSAPTGYRVSNLVVRPLEGQKPDDPKLREVAELLRTRLDEGSVGLDLMRVREEFPSEYPVHVDLHLVFPTEEQGAIPPKWLKVDAEFAKQVKAGVAAKQKVIGPFSTQFGWHVVLFEEVLEGKSPSDAEVERLARHTASTEARREKMVALIADELKARTWSIYPDVFEQESQ